MSQIWGKGKQGSKSEGDSQGRLVTLGRISGMHGVQGWVKVFSDTEPRGNILNYSPWFLKLDGAWQPCVVEQGRDQTGAVVAKLQGVSDRDQARALMGAEIAVPRSAFSKDVEPDEYYWTDLEGLRVVNLQGVELGKLDHLFETGSNDVMVVRGERERLVPYIWQQVVREVDLDAGQVTVDWDAEF